MEYPTATRTYVQSERRAVFQHRYLIAPGFVPGGSQMPLLRRYAHKVTVRTGYFHFMEMKEEEEKNETNRQTRVRQTAQ